MKFLKDLRFKYLLFLARLIASSFAKKHRRFQQIIAYSYFFVPIILKYVFLTYVLLCWGGTGGIIVWTYVAWYWAKTKVEYDEAHQS
jgi:hypothetical protein